MTTDLSSKTVEELTAEEFLAEVAEYFSQDFNKTEGNWQFLPASCPFVSEKIREIARRLEEAQQKIVAQQVALKPFAAAAARKFEQVRKKP